MDMNLSKLWEIVKDREALWAVVMGTQLSDWTIATYIIWAHTKKDRKETDRKANYGQFRKAIGFSFSFHLFLLVGG